MYIKHIMYRNIVNIPKIISKELIVTLQKQQQIIEKTNNETNVIKHIPQPPTKNVCCENGCSNCVWNIYFNNMNDYRKKLEIYENLKIPNKGK